MNTALLDDPREAAYVLDSLKAPALDRCGQDFAFFLRFFVNEFPKIHYTTNRRGGPGGNLYKVHLGIAGNLQCLADRYNTDITAIWADQANLRDADALIYSKFVGADMLLLVIYETNPA